MELVSRQPAVLLAVPVIIAALAVLGWKARGHSNRWKAACLFFPLAAGICALTAASKPEVIFNPPARNVVVLVDLSPAARTAPWRRPALLRNLLRHRLPAGTRLTLVGFCRRPHRIAANLSARSRRRWPKRWPRMAGSCADIQRAIQWNSKKVTGNPRWIFTAGLVHWPTMQPAHLPFELALSIVKPRRADAGITSLHLSASRTGAHVPGAGARRTLSVGVHATGAMNILVEVFQNRRPLARTPLLFRRAGSKIVQVRDIPLQKTSDSHPDFIRVRLVTKDPWPEDDHAEMIISTGGPPRILVVRRRSALTSPVSMPQTVMVSAARIPRNLEALSRYQVIILDNVPRRAFEPGAGRMLAKFVERTGGGLLIIGARNAFGPGGYALATPRRRPWAIEQISPLSSLPPHRPAIQVIFLIDASGSMGQRVHHSDGQTRLQLAARAVTGALAILKPADRAQILAFSGITTTLLGGTVKTIRNRIANVLDRVEPTGPTNPDSALPLLDRIFTASREQTELILLTDGRIPHLQVQRWARLMKRRRAKLAIIAPLGPTPALQSLARRTNAMIFSTDHPLQWAYDLKLSLYRRLAGRARRKPIAWRSARGRLGGTTRAWIEVWRKKAATALASSGKGGYSLAAVWRRGLGKVAAVAFVSHSTAYTAFLRHLIHRLSPPAGDRRFQVKTTRQENRWLIRVDAQGSRHFLNGQDLRLSLIQPRRGARGRTLQFTQTAPGRYVLRPPASVQAFSGVITRRKDQRRVFVGRLAPPDLPTCCFPATAAETSCPWRHVRRINVLRNWGRQTAWRPRIHGFHFHFSWILWLASCGLVLAALWLLRTGGES